MLTNFATHVDAKIYADFYDPRQFPTVSKLEDLMYGADRLHVNLDGLVDDPRKIGEIVQKGSRGLEWDNNVTNWEIWRIHQDSNLLKKTTFYYDGKPTLR